MRKQLVSLSHHVVDDVSGRRLVRLLQDPLQEEGVLGESLVRLGQHVGELQAVALLVRLGPLRQTKTGYQTFNEPESRGIKKSNKGSSTG